jgi:hypothetical protein
VSGYAVQMMRDTLVKLDAILRRLGPDGQRIIDELDEEYARR